MNLLRWLLLTAKRPVFVGLSIIVTILAGLSQIAGFNVRDLPDYWETIHRAELNDEARIALATRLRGLVRDGSLSVDESRALRDYAAGLKLDSQVVEQYLSELGPRMVRASKDLQEGAELAAQERFSEARSRFREAIALDDQNAAAWANFGGAALELGATDEAQAALRKALALNPESIEANYNLGACLAARSQNSSAFDHLERSLALMSRGDSPPIFSQEALLADLQNSPHFASLRTSSRFTALLLQVQNGSH